MEREINFAVGFVTGRPNVCNIINNYYQYMLEQIAEYKIKINLTLYILFDLEYEYRIRTEFYNVIPDVYRNLKVKYITPEDIEEEKKKLMSRYEFKKDEVDLLLGHGHAKGRNTVMYYAYKEKIDYLLFWDDDEYPVASIKEDNNEIIWKKQKNILQHIIYMQKSDITIGHHCGYISPIPYLELNKQIPEEDFKAFIDSVGNEAFTWETIKGKITTGKGITYANKDIADEKGVYTIKKVGLGDAVAGSTLCLNLHSIDKIPAFYNPPKARGEDAFFSALLGECKVTKIPLYHFHDGFLKYTSIMKEKYPKVLRRIVPDENDVEQRFIQASKGWIKYKPLLLYILDKKSYREKINETYGNLEKSIPKMNEIFGSDRFDALLDALIEYDKNVEKHYRDFIKTNDVWNKAKCVILARN